MKNITVFVSENFKVLKEKFSIYLNRRVFVIEYATIFQHLSESRFMPHTLHRIIKGCVCVCCGGGGGGGVQICRRMDFLQTLHVICTKACIATVINALRVLMGAVA